MCRKRIALRIALEIVLCVGLATPTLLAQELYSWTDEAGNLHFVDSLDLVPESHRVKAQERAKAGVILDDETAGNYNLIPVSAELLELRQVTDTGDTNVDNADKSVKKPGKVDAKDEDPLKDKAYWQARLQECRDRKSSAEEELRTIGEEMFRVRTLTPINFQQKLVELEQRRQELDAEIVDANRGLEEVIPEEARKAGVPPGWLR